MLYWKYSDALLEISRCFVRNIQMLYWKYPDVLLEIYRCFVRNIQMLYWKHPDALFKVSLHFLNVPRYWSIPIRITIWKYHYICLVIRSSFDCNINIIHVRKKKENVWRYQRVNQAIKRRTDNTIRFNILIESDLIYIYKLTNNKIKHVI